MLGRNTGFGLLLALMLHTNAPGTVHAQTSAEPSDGKPSVAPKPGPSRVVSVDRSTTFGSLRVFVFTADPAAAKAAATAAFDIMEKTLVKMGTTTQDSDVSRLNLAAGGDQVSLSADTFRVLEKGKEIGSLTQGAFAVTRAPLASAWSFASDSPTVPEPGRMLERAEKVDDSKLTLAEGSARLQESGMAVSISGLARGAALEKAAALLARRGFKNVLLVVGSDMVARGNKGTKPWLVGLQDPRASGYFATVPIQDEAVATAGDFQEFVEVGSQRFHSILDPRTGYPAQGCRSVTVVAEDAPTAQGFARGLFVMGPEKALALVEQTDGVAAVIVSASNEVTLSSGLRDRTRLVRPPTP